MVLKNGRISEIGTFQELLGHKAAFAEFVLTYLNDPDTNDDIDPDCKCDCSSSALRLERPRTQFLAIVIYIKTVLAFMCRLLAVVATPDDSLHPMFLFSVVYSKDTWWAYCMRKYPVNLK